MRTRAALVVLTLIAGCSRRDEGVRGVPDKELARPVPSASVVPQCNPACEAGVLCVDGLCAEPIDWAHKASPTMELCPVGERRAVSCPATTAAITTVWGSDIYTTDSAVCTAALHAGKITTAGGNVVYELRPGQTAYDNSTRNGVATNSWGSYGCSFVFRTKACAAGMTSCGELCANLQSDVANCGSCGVGCAIGESCRKGVCAPGIEADYGTVAGTPCSGTRTSALPSALRRSGTFGARASTPTTRRCAEPRCMRGRSQRRRAEPSPSRWPRGFRHTPGPHATGSAASRGRRGRVAFVSNDLQRALWAIRRCDRRVVGDR